MLSMKSSQRVYLDADMEAGVQMAGIPDRNTGRRETKLDLRLWKKLDRKAGKSSKRLFLGWHWLT